MTEGEAGLKQLGLANYPVEEQEEEPGSSFARRKAYPLSRFTKAMRRVNDQLSSLEAPLLLLPELVAARM